MLGTAVGLVLGYFLGGDGTTAGPLLFGLTIVPIVIWISPKRPLLGWQLPIIAFSVSSVLAHPDYPGQPFDLASTLVMIVMEWAMLLAFSSLWGLFLLRRARAAGSAEPGAIDEVKPYMIAVCLIIAGAFLLLVGWAMVFAPNTSAWAPPGGLLVGTLGIAAWKYCGGIVSRLGKTHEYARHSIQLALLSCPLMVLGGGHSSGQTSGWSTIVFASLLGIESLAVLIWLFLAKPAPQNGLSGERSNS
jgi:hypothetical protein